MQGKTMSKEYWNALYDNNEIGWDIGFPSPPLMEYIDQLENRSISVLIPGCGNAYEASHLLARGFPDITVIDIAPSLTTALETKFRKELGKRMKVITGDFFKHEGKYDLILEQTFLSALDPSVRTTYVEKMYSLLKPHGKLVGVLFNRAFEDGPPFGGTIEEYQTLFPGKFRIRTLAPCYNSIERRKGSEAFINMTAR